MAIAEKFAETFKDFPPIQKPNTFTIDDAIKMMQTRRPAGTEPAHLGRRVVLAARPNARGDQSSGRRRKVSVPGADRRRVAVLQRG